MVMPGLLGLGLLFIVVDMALERPNNLFGPKTCQLPKS